MKREPVLGAASYPKVSGTKVENWDPRLGIENERLTPTEDLKDFQISPFNH